MEPPETLWGIHQKTLLRQGFKPINVFICSLVTTPCIWDPCVTLSFSQDELLSIKTRTVNQKQNHRRQKARLIYLSDFPRTMDLDVLGLGFVFGRWYCICAVLLAKGYFQHGVSWAKVWWLSTSRTLLLF